MKKIVTFIAMAMVLGVVALLIPIPIMTYKESFVTTGYSQEPSRFENDLNITRLRTLEEAAQRYGKIDTGPAPFPTSLLHVLLVVATGLFTALGISRYVKKRIK